MDKFLNVYQQLDASNLQLLETIYAEKIHFIDPAHEIHGLKQLTDYFYGLYKTVSSISFEFQHPHRLGPEAYVQWVMTFSHPRLQNGKTIALHGASYLQFNRDEKVTLHRDYFDLGAMIYERLPVVGRIVTAIKGRLGS